MPFFRIDKIMHQLYVHYLSGKCNIIVCQYVALKLKVVPILCDILVGQYCGEVGDTSTGSYVFLAVKSGGSHSLYCCEDPGLFSIDDYGYFASCLGSLAKCCGIGIPE